MQSRAKLLQSLRQSISIFFVGFGAIGRWVILFGVFAV